MQMQPQNAHSRPKCRQALLKCVKEAWYQPRSNEEEGEKQIMDEPTEAPSRDPRDEIMRIDRLNRVLILVFGGSDIAL
jgi:hypothetical protein